VREVKKMNKEQNERIRDIEQLKLKKQKLITRLAIPLIMAEKLR